MQERLTLAREIERRKRRKAYKQRLVARGRKKGHMTGDLSRFQSFGRVNFDEWLKARPDPGKL